MNLDESFEQFFDELDDWWVNLRVRRKAAPVQKARVNLEPQGNWDERLAVKNAIPQFAQRLDVLENTPAAQEQSVTGLTQRVFTEWEQWLQLHELHVANQELVRKVRWALKCRATTTSEKTVGRVLRSALAQTAFPEV